MDGHLRRSNRGRVLVIVAVLMVLVAMMQIWVSDAFANTDQLLIYSGRSEALVEPLIERFEAKTGIKTVVRYGNGAELVALILEEGRRSPADLFWSVDAGSVGALASMGRLTTLDPALLAQVDERLVSPDGYWLATSGRARVIAYNTEVNDVSQLPSSIWEFTEPEWHSRIGWAPTNASFHDFVTALRLLEGEARAAQWLRAIQANRPRVYSNNTAIVDALSRKEIEVGLVNHYYLHRFRAERGSSYPVWYYHLDGDAGSIINTAAIGIVNTSTNVTTAEAFIDFLLSAESQQFFAEEVFEYPVVVTPGVEIDPSLTPLEHIHTPQVNLSDLEDLEGTLMLLERTGVL